MDWKAPIWRNATALWLLILLCLVAAPTTRRATAGPAAPTFSRDIAPILYQNCVVCHRQGASAPFPLLSYADASKRARQIALVTERGLMPPWKAEPGYGEFANARRLTAAQIAAIRTWAEQGAPEGDKADLSPLPAPTTEWRLGKPDKIVRMPDFYVVPPGGPDLMRCFVVPMNLQQDVWLRAVEFHPGNPRVVHDALMFLDSTGLAARLEAQLRTVGYASMGGPGMIPGSPYSEWMPGALPTFLLPGVARLVRKGTDLVLLTHFHPDGKPETELSTIGLYLSKTPPDRQLAVAPLASKGIYIKAGQRNYRVRASFTLPVDVEAVGILPHAHYLCTQIQSSAILPNGVEQPLLWIKDWDYDRQDVYQYSHPVVLPAGTRLTAEFTYDNSANNLRNPSSPPRFVMWGARMMDEMASLWIQVLPRRASDLPKLNKAIMETARGVANPGFLSGHAMGPSRYRVWEAQRRAHADQGYGPDMGERRATAPLHRDAGKG
jgi:mono/diheme cytochrome c family protein